MDAKKAGVLQIGTALIFAGAIMFLSWILGDSEYAQTMTLILIALYMVPFSILSAVTVKKGKKIKSIIKKRQCCHCLFLIISQLYLLNEWIAMVLPSESLTQANTPCSPMSVLGIVTSAPSFFTFSSATSMSSTVK